jgi:hypothetical protein
MAPLSSFVRFAHKRNIQRIFFCAFSILSIAALTCGQSKIEIKDPILKPGDKWPSPLELSFTASPEIKKIRILITAPANNSKDEFNVDANAVDQTRSLNLLDGLNDIQILGFKEGDKDSSASAKLSVTCSGKKCGTNTASQGGGGNQQTPPPSTGTISILQPTGGTVDNGLITSVISVQKSEIQSVFLKVVNGGKSVEQEKKVTSQAVKYSGNLAILTPSIRLKQGTNIITVFSLDTGKEEQSTVTVTCSGAKCDNPDVAEDHNKGITIEIPATDEKVKDQPFVNSTITVDNQKQISKLFVRVLNEGKPLDKALAGEAKNPIPITLDATNPTTTIGTKIRVGPGSNIITVFDPDKPEQTRPQTSTTITCVGDKCGAVETPKITIAWPKVKQGQTAVQTDDGNPIDASITVGKESNITKVQYDVIHEGKPIYTSETKTVDASQGPASVPFRLRFLKGLNTIRVYDAEHPGGDNQASIAIECAGDKCPTDFDVMTIVTNSQNTRLVVGLEQVGASSSSGQTKPFFDMFFTTPIHFDRGSTPDLLRTTAFDEHGEVFMDGDTPKLVWIRRSTLANGDELVSTTELDVKGNPVLDDNNQKKYVWIRRSALPPRPLGAPRFGFWGNVRITTTPEQLTTTGVLPANLANLAATTGAPGNLVSSFDFLAGVEYRLFTANGTFLSLIPGIKQKTRFVLAAGTGAISPLDATQQAPKFSVIPAENSSQRALFEKTYGTPPTRKLADGTTVVPSYLGVVPLDRDRFLKQWYAGIRLKTFYCERDIEGGECLTFRNTFPAIVDFMVGQSESVTGGTYKTTEITDPKTGASRNKSAFVFRLDAFYPLPIREASFIYFYGTAVMKIGGHPKIENFLVLEAPADSPNINDPKVYVPPVDFLKSLQSNRDYYKIGVGINLTDFFNRNKPK